MRSFLSRPVLLLSVTLASAAVAAIAISERVSTMVISASCWAAEVLLAVIAGPKLSAVAPKRPLSPDLDLQRAGHFHAAFLKRERPSLTASWRMCPSI